MVNLEKLRALRQERELSIGIVSEKLGFKSSQGYYYKETGRRDITAEELGKLAQLFNVPVGELYIEDAVVATSREQEDQPD